MTGLSEQYGSDPDDHRNQSYIAADKWLNEAYTAMRYTPELNPAERAAIATACCRIAEIHIMLGDRSQAICGDGRQT